LEDGTRGATLIPRRRDETLSVRQPNGDQTALLTLGEAVGAYCRGSKWRREFGPRLRRDVQGRPWRLLSPCRPVIRTTQTRCAGYLLLLVSVEAFVFQLSQLSE